MRDTQLSRVPASQQKYVLINSKNGLLLCDPDFLDYVQKIATTIYSDIDVEIAEFIAKPKANIDYSVLDTY